MLVGVNSDKTLYAIHIIGYFFMQTRMNVQQEGTIVSTTVLILPAASDVVALMDTREME